VCCVGEGGLLYRLRSHQRDFVLFDQSNWVAGLHLVCLDQPCYVDAYISVYIGVSTLHKVDGLLIKITETANRRVEDLDLLFTGKNRIYWRAEKGSSS
jgi:hypothetical protein